MAVEMEEANSEMLLLPAAAAEETATAATATVADSSNSSTLEQDPEDFDEIEYLALVLGPQRQTLDKLVPLTVIYVVMSITGVFGNLSVCCVILRIPGMRSATNYYLFSLAVADLLILFFGESKCTTGESRGGFPRICCPIFEE